MKKKNYDIGKLFKCVRLFSGLTLEQSAQITKMAKSSISRIERGKRKPKNIRVLEDGIKKMLAKNQKRTPFFKRLLIRLFRERRSNERLSKSGNSASICEGKRE